MKEKVHEELAERSTERLLLGVQEGSRLWEAEGRDAWLRLGRLRNAKLDSKDVEVIAKRLHTEFPKFKAMLKDRGISLGEFCLSAGLGKEGEYSKNLHRMMMPPGKSAKEIGLRRSAGMYRDLLAAMAKTKGESVDVLANTLLVGTSLHPANAGVRDDIALVQLTLQAFVDTVDKEFGLYKTFVKTAKLKAKHSAGGGKCRWPNYDLDDLGLEPGGDSTIGQNNASDSSQAYWRGPISKKTNFTKWFEGYYPNALQEQLLLQDESFFYVPHAYLGCDEFGYDTYKAGIYGDSWRKAPARDEWCAETCSPKGQTTRNNALYQYSWWLTIYPTPDSSRLMPMIYLPGEEGGAILIPLDAVSLHAVRSLRLVTPDGQTINFFDRIKDLIGYRPNERQEILENLRRTAPWLMHNPLIKLEKSEEQDQVLIETFYRRLTQADSND